MAIAAAKKSAAARAMAGMPPLSGFLGKLLVLDALRDPGYIGWAWPAILAGSLITIVGFARAGSILFWKSTAVPVPEPEDDDPPEQDAVMVAKATPTQVAPTMMAIAALAALAIFAGPVSGYLEDTSSQLFDRAGYIASVLEPVEEG